VSSTRNQNSERKDRSRSERLKGQAAKANKKFAQKGWSGEEDTHSIVNRLVAQDISSKTEDKNLGKGVILFVSTCTSSLPRLLHLHPKTTLLFPPRIKGYVQGRVKSFEPTSKEK
jgi:hypothetical protein